MIRLDKLFKDHFNFVKMHACIGFWMHQDMDEGSIRQRKESQNGSTGHNLDERTKDESAAKATVLQKDVSVPVCAWEQFTQQVHTAN